MKCTTIDSLLSIEAVGKLALPTGFGQCYFGWSEFGDWNDYSGIYQQRMERKNYWTKTVKLKGKKYTNKMRPWWPTYTNSEAQQTVRGKFRLGIEAYQALTPEEKAELNTKATRQSKRGFDLFMHRYMTDQL